MAGSLTPPPEPCSVTLVSNPRGNYRFLPGGEPFSSGAVADTGYEILHVTLSRLLPYRAGFQLIEEHLHDMDRPWQALCAVEMRSPRPFSRAGFTEFNRDYRQLLEECDLLVQGQNPVARTNVAPALYAPIEPSLYGFSFTSPQGMEISPEFVVSGAAELRGGPMETAQVVRPGETSPEAMREKAAYVMDVMARRLDALGVGWEQVTTIDLYTVAAIEAALGPVILDAAGPAALHGIRWFHARPPIDELEFEMDVRGVGGETALTIGAGEF